MRHRNIIYIDCDGCHAVGLRVLVLEEDMA